MGEEDGDDSPPVQQSYMDALGDNLGWKPQFWAIHMFRAIDKPVTYFRENVVEPLQSKNKEKFYHRKFNRVPTVDQCVLEDPVCIYEADEQFKRDRLVDSMIVKILRNRMNECFLYEGPDWKRKCRDVQEHYEGAATNWHIKYGDIRATKASVEVYMKQKHRLIWERRNPDIKLH